MSSSRMASSSGMLLCNALCVLLNMPFVCEFKSKTFSSFFESFHAGGSTCNLASNMNRNFVVKYFKILD